MIPSDGFKSLSELRELELNGDQASGVSLQLTACGAGNQFCSIEDGAFNGLSKLQHLEIIYGFILVHMNKPTQSCSRGAAGVL